MFIKKAALYRWPLIKEGIAGRNIASSFLCASRVFVLTQAFCIHSPQREWSNQGPFQVRFFTPLFCPLRSTPKAFFDATRQLGTPCCCVIAMPWKTKILDAHSTPQQTNKANNSATQVNDKVGYFNFHYKTYLWSAC